MPFKVLQREVKILNGSQALAELRDMIISSISVELVGDKKKLKAWPKFLKAWLVLTSDNYHRNIYSRFQYF